MSDEEDLLYRMYVKLDAIEKEIRVARQEIGAHLRLRNFKKIEEKIEEAEEISP